MRIFLLILFLFFSVSSLFANTVTGIVTDSKGNILPFSSILIKGTSKGTSANSKGKYSLQIEEGTYILICQHVGYKSVEKKIVIAETVTMLDFLLEEQSYNLNNVTVTTGSEDPAYEIIRKTIAKREEHLNNLKKFEVEVYLKGELQLRNYPKKFMGKDVDFEDGDTSKRKIIFLSESVSHYSVDGDKKKTEVISTRVSGRSNGFGFGSPYPVSFYENNIQIADGLNPRGFISPISNNALYYYKYKFEGTFFEYGLMINRIKVIPKRTYEPLFSGYINIVEDEWQLQSVELTLLKQNQMQLLDTLRLQQLYVPLQNIWVLKQQVTEPAGKFFSFDFFGSVLQVFSQYNINPSFQKKYFNNTIIKYGDSSNKKTIAYWDSIRPVPLLDNEINDYKKKDSLEQFKKQPGYLDSLDRKKNKPTFSSLFLTGYKYSIQKNKTSLSFDPLLYLIGVNYNSVEGRFSKFGATYSKYFKNNEQENLMLNPQIRYGYGNHHFNAFINTHYTFGKNLLSSIEINGGKKVFQFNNDNPITDENNTLSTFLWLHNHIKIYEAGFVKLGFVKSLRSSFTTWINIEYQNRKPLNNIKDSLRGKAFTPNYPTDILTTQMQAHKALAATIGVRWIPGSKYIQLPNRTYEIPSSKFPKLEATLTHGFNNVLGSDVDYTKWNFTVEQSLNFKIGGRFDYRISTGGFLNTNKVFAPDYIHFLGNETVLANQYLQSFQLLPYYRYSNTEKLYAAAYAEYHLNGLISNKIPLFKKLNCFFVVGGNALLLNKHNPYFEGYFSIENILKIFRIDAVKSFGNNLNKQGIRISIPFLPR